MQLTILVCDDSILVRRQLRDLLEELGCRVIEAKNGLEGVKLYKEENPHATFMDIVMPVMDGLELLRNLRANRATKGVGFILVTGKPTPELVAKGRSLGMNNMIKKPFTTAQLKACIEQVVGPLA